MRLYVPLTPAQVAQCSQGQAVDAHRAFCVTPAVVRLAPEADTEEHEYLVTQFAAASCPGRIVVGVFDAPTANDTAPLAANDTAPLVANDRAQPTDATSGGDGSGAPGAVQLTADLHPRDLVCFLVGDVGASVTEDADVELSWYDRSEAHLVRTEVGA